MSGIKGMNICNTNGFVKGEQSLMKGKTKEAGLYPKNCGFQKGHKSYSYIGMNAEQIHIKTATWIDFKCLECGKEFKIREHSTGRGRGKYCSRDCFNKALKKRIPHNKGILETKKCLQCDNTFEIRPCEKDRKYCSRRCVGLAKPKTPNWGKYKGINMRSGYEIGYAKYLDRNIIKWEYEPKTFDLGNTAYTPDFYLPESDTYVEIKGWMRKEASIKIKKFIKQNPNIKYLLLGERKLKEIGAIH